MKQFSNRLLSISLAFILFCMSLFGSFAVPTIKVKGVEVLALYTVEEIMATILFSLGVTIQGYDSLTDGSSALDLTSDRYQVIQGGGGSQEDPDQDPDPSSYVILPSKQDALSFEEQLKLSQEYEQYKFDEMIANAQQTGKIVIDKASGAWDFLKEQAGELFSKLKRPSIDSEAYEAYYNMGNFDNSTYHVNFYNYLDSVIFNLYNKYGVQTSGHFSDYDASYFYSSSSSAYYIIYSALQSNGTYTVHGIVCSSIDDLMKITKQIRTDLVSPTSKTYYTCSVWNFYPNPVDGQYRSGGYSSYNVNRYGQCDDLIILNPAQADLLSNSYTPNLDYKSDYDNVYSPAPDHATDIITPSNTVIPNPDGSYSIGGNYVIDVTNPVTYPVDLTDGVTLDDSKTPITELAPAEDQPGEIDPDPEPEPEPELSFWERLFEWLKRIYDLLTQLPQILTDHGLTLGNIVTSLSSINLTVGAIQQIADSLLTAFNGLEIPDYSDLIQEVPSKIAEALEFPEINFPEIEIPDYTSFFEQMLEFLSYLPKLGNIESLLTSIFVVDFNAVNDALYKALDVWDFDFLKDLQNLIGLLKYADDYRYPKFKIKCPAILAPYYDNDEIVLCDFANYKVQLLWCRNAIRMMLWVYFLYCVFRHFKVRFTVS